jgi:hypothetical protein
LPAHVAVSPMAACRMRSAPLQPPAARRAAPSPGTLGLDSCRRWSEVAVPPLVHGLEAHDSESSCGRLTTSHGDSPQSCQPAGRPSHWHEDEDPRTYDGEVPERSTSKRRRNWGLSLGRRSSPGGPGPPMDSDPSQKLEAFGLAAVWLQRFNPGLKATVTVTPSQRTPRGRQPPRPRSSDRTLLHEDPETRRFVSVSHYPPRGRGRARRRLHVG